MAVAGPILIQAAGARDALGVNLRPATVVVAEGRVVATLAPEAARKQYSGVVPGAKVVDLPGTLILPALVNAHAHLDLSLLGPQPFSGDFVQWLGRITELRLGAQSPEQIIAAVRTGLVESHRAGVGFLGDIAGSALAAETRIKAVGQSAVTPASPLPTSPHGGGERFIPGKLLEALPGAFPGTLPGGVSYVECFGLGRSQAEGFMELMKRLASLPKPGPGVGLGISPHAPYTAGFALYSAAGRYAREHDLALCTHLAESPEELEFVRDMSGAFAESRRARGKWDDTFAATGLHPVDWLQPELRQGDWLIAHANYVDEAQIRTLAWCRASVAYCPRASAYFGHAGHRYREMIAAGVNVCLGTDSILCQPGDEKQPHGIWPQMRYLFQRDGTDPALLLRMATVNGLQAMGLAEHQASLQPGTVARLIGVEVDANDPTDLLTQALRRQPAVRPIMTA